MKQITLNLNKKNVEDILKSLIKYRLSLMDEMEGIKEKYIDSLSHTGYILELIKNQSFGEDMFEETKISLDLESYLNVYDILTYQVDSLNSLIIDNLEIDNQDSMDHYKEERDEYKALYNKINIRRFEALHI